MRQALIWIVAALAAVPVFGQSDTSHDRLKEAAQAQVGEMSKLTQVMVDKIFSFGELGFQEVETSKYIVAMLRENGFEVEEGISGIPTAWMATSGSGRPVIALGSDIDGIPKASQKPGVAYHDPLVEGAPGHGEGHNSGQAVNVTAAIVVKRIMEREKIPGTLKLWPGVAEELVATKAWFVRDGFFDGVDVCIFTHVSNDLTVSWGQGSGNGLISVEYTFLGESAHSAGAPWRGRSALDAVELMNTAINYRREHLRLPQRIHYVITNGGDQPNVVPSVASVWYYFRELDHEHMKGLFEMGNKAAQAAADMTDTEVSWRILGHAYPRHFNKVVAETMWKNIEKVGLPEWSEADHKLARGLQKELGVEEEGLKTELGELGGPPEGPNMGGGSDDIGDISWNLPTVTLRFPSNIPGGPGHHWANAVAMATPIAHKGATAGAKVVAMTALDLFLAPELVDQAWDYFKNEQTKDHQYTPFITENDPPAIHLNKERMDSFREAMRAYYYDETKYDTYLEQLGIQYPTVRETTDEKQH
ncbi:MAG TPA: amidohydrolase [Vicinamibacteria bacterium]|nr:amidohydrolase [Vicinamibacteria bacterium]